MADLPILLALLAVAWSAWCRPWVGVLGLVFVGVMHPQGYATGWLQGAPVYLALGIVVALSAARRFVIERQLPTLFWDWRFGVAALLAVQMVLSTWLGVNPWVGWIKLGDIARMLPLLLLVLLLIDDREKLQWLLVTIALSISVVVLKGGFWAVLTGFHDRVYGPPGSQFADNNEFAVATAMAIPLIALWFRHIGHRVLRWCLGGMVSLGFVAALSSWSRGGLLCLAVVAGLLMWHSRRRWLMLPLLLGALGIALVALPGAWFARMSTLFAPATEGSAAARLEVWTLGWTYALQHPWFGGGLGGWIYLSLPTGGMRAWHSAYVGMAAEHGLLGLLIWCTWLFGTLADLSRIIWQKQRASASWLTDQAAMLRASLAAYVVGSAFLSIAYWELLYLLLIASILLSRLARQEERAVSSAPRASALSESLTTERR